MYATTNYKTKKALQIAVADGEKVTYYQPGIGDTPTDGTIYVEGPHYPEPHRWYAQCTAVNGAITKVK